MKILNKIFFSVISIHQFKESVICKVNKFILFLWFVNYIFLMKEIYVENNVLRIRNKRPNKCKYLIENLVNIFMI